MHVLEKALLENNTQHLIVKLDPNRLALNLLRNLFSFFLDPRAPFLFHTFATQFSSFCAVCTKVYNFDEQHELSSCRQSRPTIQPIRQQGAPGVF